MGDWPPLVQSDILLYPCRPCLLHPPPFLLVAVASRSSIPGVKHAERSAPIVRNLEHGHADPPYLPVGLPLHLAQHEHQLLQPLLPFLEYGLDFNDVVIELHQPGVRSDLQSTACRSRAVMRVRPLVSLTRLVARADSSNCVNKNANTVGAISSASRSGPVGI